MKPGEEGPITSFRDVWLTRLIECGPTIEHREQPFRFREKPRLLQIFENEDLKKILIDAMARE